MKTTEWLYWNMPHILNYLILLKKEQLKRKTIKNIEWLNQILLLLIEAIMIKARCWWLKAVKNKHFSIMKMLRELERLWQPRKNLINYRF